MNQKNLKFLATLLGFITTIGSTSQAAAEKRQLVCEFALPSAQEVTLSTKYDTSEGEWAIAYDYTNDYFPDDVRNYRITAIVRKSRVTKDLLNGSLTIKQVGEGFSSRPNSAASTCRAKNCQMNVQATLSGIGMFADCEIK